MKICPVCSYKANNYLSYCPEKQQQKRGAYCVAQKQVFDSNEHYNYLKNSILFKGKKEKKPKTYLSSKYLFLPQKDSILQKGDKIRLNKTEYPKEEIYEILREKSADEQTATFLAYYLEDLVAENSPQADYIKKIIELVYADKLPASVLFGLEKGADINENLKQDIDKLFECYKEGKNVADCFVPNFKTREEAIYELSTGDVCQIGDDDRISIKKNGNEIEKLFISKKTYLELFPPVERFLYTQSKQQDCYFISVFDSIYSNPNSRYKILSLFNERKNGKVDATFGGYKYIGENATNKDFSRYVLKDLSKTLNAARRLYAGYMSYTMEGLRALEVLNSEEKRKNAESKINKKYHFYKKLLAQSSGKTIIYGDFQYSRDELQDFVDLYESSKTLRKIISTEDMNIPVFDVDYGSVLYGLKLLDKKQDKEDKWERYILERYKDYLERTGRKTISFREIMPMETYQKIFNWQINESTPSPYTYGGNSFSVFNIFNLPTMLLPLNNHDTADKILSMPDIENRVVLTCSSSHSDKTGHNIKPNHSYSLVPKEKDGKRKFIAKNPANTTQQIELDINELKKCFDVLEIGLIEPLSFYLP